MATVGETWSICSKKGFEIAKLAVADLIHFQPNHFIKKEGVETPSVRLLAYKKLIIVY